jgi:hypothetical protein
MQRPNAHPNSKLVARAWLGGYAALLCLFVAQASERPPYDDSYFFKRFALNFLDHGAFAWNLTDGPVYGNTSQLHQLLVTLITALTRTRTLSVLRVLLAAALLGGLASLLASARRYHARAAALFAFCSPVVLFCALSGMETAFVFLLLALFLGACDPARVAQRHWALGPSLCVVLWLARPDTLLLSVPVWLGASYRDRSRWLRGSLLITGCVALCLIAFKLYYGTALPLPFYAKQQAYSPYDADFLALSDLAGRQRFSVFAWAAAPLCLMALARRDAWNWLLLTSASAFVLYHRIATVDIMGMHGRFYVPAIPHLVLAAGRGERLHARSRLRFVSAAAYAAFVVCLFGAELPPVGELDEDDNLTPAYYALGTLSGFWVLSAPLRGSLRALVPPVVLMLAALACAVSFHPKRFVLRSDRALLALHERRYSVFRGLEQLRACFGEAIHVYHSEVGVLGLRFQAGRVTDLAGLLSPDWLFQRTSFDSACRADRPEGLFLPHRVYVALNEEIQRSQCIKGYVRVIEDSSSPLYVRADLHKRYEACDGAR